MSRIEDIFADRRAQSLGTLMPFVVGGHPSPDALPSLLTALERGGASIVEIGFPFSDPIADGPVIAAAMHEALEAGTTPEQIFQQVESARDQTKLGLVAMVSVSIVYRLGGAKGFVDRAKQAGIDGFIFPDAPLEESGPLLAAVKDAGLNASLLVAPSTPPPRAAKIAAACSGFVYLLARAGITGTSDRTPQIARGVDMLREHTDLPIACGFGISSAAHVEAVTKHADAAIVGSALVSALSKAHADGSDPAEAAQAFAADLASGLTAPGIAK